MSSSRSGVGAGGALVLLVAALAGCSTPGSNAAPGDLDMSCQGDGSPTVVMVPGLATDSSTFLTMRAELSDDMRVCIYSRAGLGGSPAWPDDLPDPSAGAAADQLLATLERNDEPGPFVMLGWSYGGLVTQAFAARHADLLAGVVLEDSAAAELFDSPDWSVLEWTEGGRDIDIESTADEVDELDLGTLPLVVLTQGTMADWPDPQLWVQLQDQLATLSNDVIHVTATDAGHVIHADAQALVVRAVEEVLAAVESGDPMSCDADAWALVAGVCEAP